MAVYIAQINPPDGPIKIGFSRQPHYRISGLANRHRCDVKLLAILAGDPRHETTLQNRFLNDAIDGKLDYFHPSPALMEYISKKQLKTPFLHKYRTRAEFYKAPKGYMTEERIKRAGELLNSGMSGPKVAAKLKCSTASIYAHWKQHSKGKFIRKRKKK